MLSDVLPVPSWTISLSLVLVLVVCYIVYYVQSLQGLPPFPAYPIPIFGNLVHMEKNPRNQLKRWRRKHGDVYSLYFGQVLIIVLNGFEVMREALVKHADQLSDRPVLFYDVVTNTVNMGIAESSGPQWKEERTVVIRLLKAFGMGKNILADKISEEISHFLDELKKRDRKPIDLKTMLTHTTSNVICSILIGKRFEYDDLSFIRLISCLDQNFSIVSNNFIVNFIPQLQYLPGDLFKAKLVKSNLLEVMGLFAEHYVREMSKPTSNSDNYVSSYLSERDRKLNSGEHTYMNKRTLEKTLTDLFAGGTETASVTLQWWFLYMIHYPNVQNKAFEEIKREIGLQRRPRMTDKGNMKYVTAMIMETQRLASVAPLSLLHSCREEFQFRGFTIPKGANIAPCLDSVLLDEDIWGEDVTVFKPERFLGTDGNLLKFDAFLPFSIGRRACPGEAMAKMELFLYVTNVLQTFIILPENPDSLPPMEGHFGLSYSPLKFNARLVQR